MRAMNKLYFGVASARADRRRFLRTLGYAAGSALFGVGGRAAAEPPLETTRVRLIKGPGLCNAALYMAEEVMRLDGFTEVEYLPDEEELGTSKLVATGEADISMSFAAPLLIRIE